MYANHRIMLVAVGALLCQSPAAIAQDEDFEEEDLERCIRTNRIQNTHVLDDYRNITGQYDAFVSVGMLEHVGPKNYADMFKQAYRMLDKRGVMVVHSIGRPKVMRHPNPWMEKYIFPGGYIPAASEVVPAIEQAGFWAGADFFAAVGGHHDNSWLFGERRVLPHLGSSDKAIHSRHLPVHQNEIEGGAFAA